jgi:hypothetical protein
MDRGFDAIVRLGIDQDLQAVLFREAGNSAGSVLPRSCRHA